MTQYNRVFNFSAGPSMLPLSVLQKAQAELLNCNGSGSSGCSGSAGCCLPPCRSSCRQSSGCLDPAPVRRRNAFRNGTAVSRAGLPAATCAANLAGAARWRCPASGSGFVTAAKCRCCAGYLKSYRTGGRTGGRASGRSDAVVFKLTIFS